MKRLTTTLLFLATCVLAFSQNTAHDINDKLGRGINFGNMFESDRNGDGLGVAIYPYYFEEIADKGFHHIRVPIKWSEYALTNAPYTIEPEFIDTIKTVVELALENKLMVMINMHHYDEIFDNPDAHTDRFLSMWSQISDAFKDYPDSLLFEPLNEPHNNLNQAKWNALFPSVIDTIRLKNPTRKVVIGPPDWNGIGSVNKLVWPESDTNLIMTVHYYNPFHFTHAGASWVEGADAWLGTTWDSTASETQAVLNDFAQAVNFYNTKDVPVHVGEFGSYSTADKESRRMWTACIARSIESFGFSWAYWEFKAGFGAYNDGLGFWKSDLLYGLTEQTDPNEYYPEAWEISNSDFSRGENSWVFYVQGGAVATLGVANDEAVINVSTATDQSWHVQFMQGDIELVKGAEYRFSFDGKVEGPQAVANADFGKNADPWTNYSGGHPFTLTDSWDTYTYDFTMNEPTDVRARIAFNLSSKVTKIYLDNIILENLYMPTFVEEITIVADPSEITTKEGSIQLTTSILPEDTTDPSVDWSIRTGADLASITSGGLLSANGTADGRVKVRATAKDGSEIYDELTLDISNQTVGIENKTTQGFYATALYQRIEYTLTASETARTINLYSIEGRKIFTGFVESEATGGSISMEGFESNIYLLELLDRAYREIFKIAYKQ